MTDNWIPPEDARPQIVCAACKSGNFMAIGPRHFDTTMQHQIMNFLDTNKTHDFEQGFIDQWGRYYSRKHAMDVVLHNGQPFNIERNGGHDEELFSEGLY